METGSVDPTGASHTGLPPHRRDWWTNHTKIRKCILAAIDGEGMPTNEEIAQRTGLSLAAVKNHLASLKQEAAARFERYKMLTDEVVMGMYRAGKKGDARAGKLFVQFVEEWEERKRITNVGANPYKSQDDESLRKALAERLAGLKGKPDAPAA